MKNLGSLILILLLGIFLTNCANNVKNIPSGFVGQVLTPTGFDGVIKESGQVDLGVTNNSGQYSTLVLLEASTITAKESFAQASDQTNNEDDRVMTQTGPLTVDVYVQFDLPSDKKLREQSFKCITPSATEDKLVSVITLQDIYNKFAKMTVRGKVRAIFAKYKDWDEVMANFEKINAEVGAAIIDVFESSNTPLKILNSQLSNVKEDPQIISAKNELKAADIKAAAINTVGRALRDNPNYLIIYQWDAVTEISKSPNAQNWTFFLNTGNKENTYALPVGKRVEPSQK